MGGVINPHDLPIGYRFHPTNEEFVNHYLKKRILGYVDNPCIIPDVDICRWDPWELPEKFQGSSIIGLDDQAKEWWFFSPHTPQAVSRSTPSGYWKKTGDDLKVRARDTDRVIGYKKTLVFHRGRGKKGVRTKWVIHEYHLANDDLNRTYVLCRLKLKRDEKADNSTIESDRGANDMADFELDLLQPDHEDSFPEHLVQAKIKSLMDSLLQRESQVEFTSADLLHLLQPVQGSTNDSFPSNIHQLRNSESPSAEDMSLDNCLTDDTIQLMFGTSEEDEDVGDVQNADLTYANFLEGYMQTELQYGQTSNSHNENPVLMNRRARSTDSVHGFVPLEEKKGTVENKFNGSPVASEKPSTCPVPMAPPARSANVKCSKDEEPRFKKVKQETAAMNIKPECISLDETAATAKVLEYKEHGSARNAPKKKNSKENEHAREKCNSLTPSTTTSTRGTKSSTNPPQPNLVNMLVGIFLMLTIARQILNF